MITCKDVVTMISSDTEASFFLRMRLWFHLLICGPCAKFREHLRMLRAAVRKFLRAQPSLTEAERIMLENVIIGRLKDKRGNAGDDKGGHE